MLDGFPRNQDNLDGWNQQIGNKANIKSVLFLECPDEICIQRCLGRGRHDDDNQVILKRIKTYYESTLPIVKHYESVNLLKKIDASKSENEVNLIFHLWVLELYLIAEIFFRKRFLKRWKNLSKL